jgi:hypothetical protein
MSLKRSKIVRRRPISSKRASATMKAVDSRETPQGCLRRNQNLTRGRDALEAVT